MAITDTPGLPFWVGSSACVGIASHLLYFIRGEHHKQAVGFVQVTFLLSILQIFGFVRIGSYSIFDAALLSTCLTGSYFVGLWTSMLLYRSLFHPLKSFPGPPGAKYSKIWHLFQLSNLDNYKKLDKWHETYGEIVRTGPNELSVVSPEGVEAIMGARSSCSKSAWYDMGLPLVSLHQCRDRAEHDKRRRAWDRGFSIKAIDGYESRVKSFANDLVDQIESFGGKPLNASLWFNYYSFDVMGDLAFGQSFDMLKTGEKHFAIKLLHEGQKPLGTLGTVPWLMLCLMKVPGISAGYHTWLSFCEDQAYKRKQMQIKEKDIMSWLLEAEPMSTDAQRNHMWLVGDARLIIVAGSDTTAATLTHIFYYLAKDPSLVKKLRQELKPITTANGDFDNKDLTNAECLNGIINEALRLHPPVPSGVSRQTPPEGITIGEYRIPGDVNVAVPLWTMGRSLKAWKQPLEFIPERWYSKPELILNKSAFAPFSVGRYGCIGKNLALMELRTVTALLVTKFDISFASGEDGGNLLHKTQDYFTLGLADMMLQFKPREK